MRERQIYLAEINPEKVADQIGDYIVARTRRFKKSGAILGLSGGVDSTTTAALANRAFKRRSESGLELVAYMLPSNENDPEDESDGKKVANKLGIRNYTVSIQPVVEALKITNPESFNPKYDGFHSGNLASEARALVLHGYAATEQKILLGTGNRDEDFGVGYYTLFGDGAVHMSPIGNLPKRLVRQIARYLGFSDLADRAPKDGLKKGRTDFNDLGYKYELVELVSEALKQGFSLEGIVQHSQVLQMADENMKLYKNDFGTYKFSNPQEMIFDILRRNQIAKDKAEIIDPKKAPITLQYNEVNVHVDENGNADYSALKSAT